jgi:hypothetical protein
MQYVIRVALCLPFEERIPHAVSRMPLLQVDSDVMCMLLLPYDFTSYYTCGVHTKVLIITPDVMFALQCPFDECKPLRVLSSVRLQVDLLAACGTK